MPKKTTTTDPDGVIDRLRRMRSIRRLASMGQATKYDERLQQIADIASGKADPQIQMQKPDPTAAARLEAGIASRSPRNALDKLPKEEAAKRIADARKEDEKARKRAEKVGRDRAERAGLDRDSEQFARTTDLT